MKKLCSVLKLILGCGFVLSLAGCVAPQWQTVQITPAVPETADGSPRFQDEGSVNAVLQFSSWDYTFLTRPQYLENGYLERVRPDNIGKVLDRMRVSRGTAAVVVGWTYNGNALDRLVADWKSILGRCGFRRVVILRAQEGDGLNGSVVIDDSTLHVSSVRSASQGG